MMKKSSLAILFSFFLTAASLGQSTTIKGQVFDYDTKLEIPGVLVTISNDDAILKQLTTNSNGIFEVTLTEQINEIEFKFIGYLTLKISNANINLQNETHDIRIPLIETPFAFISWEGSPSRKQKSEIKSKQRTVKRGIKFTCDNNENFVIRYLSSEKQQYQYVSFEELLKCSD